MHHGLGRSRTACQTQTAATAVNSQLTPLSSHMSTSLSSSYFLLLSYTSLRISLSLSLLFPALRDIYVSTATVSHLWQRHSGDSSTSHQATTSAPRTNLEPTHTGPTSSSETSSLASAAATHACGSPFTRRISRNSPQHTVQPSNNSYPYI